MMRANAWSATVTSALTVVMALAVPATAQKSPRAEDTDAEPDTLPTELGQTSVQIEGVSYGAQPDERGPIGGGGGYQHELPMMADADHVVQGGYGDGVIDQLIDALANAKPGEVVFIHRDVQIDLSVRVHVEDFVLNVPAGVTLAGDRGWDGSRGAVIFSDTLETKPLIQLGERSRLTGLRVRGPDPRHRTHELARLNREYGRRGHYRWPTSTGVRIEDADVQIDNCELSGWSFAAVQVRSEDADVWAHHNYFHHNQRRSLGYGVVLYDGSALIERNLFDYHRHSIAASGAPTEAYEARHNVVLEHASGGGAHAFDMHGERDRGDGTRVAGDRIHIHHNQFRLTHEEAVRIRGVPQAGAEIHHNWFFVEQPGGQVIDTGGNTRIYDNVYGCDPQRKP